MAPALFLTRLMSKSNPKRTKPSSSATIASRVVKLSFLLCFLTALFLLAYALQSSLLRTSLGTPTLAGDNLLPTLAGDNLLPTPWHHFNIAQKELRLSRATKIFHCSVLSCAMSSSPTPETSRAMNSSSSQCPDFFRWIHQDLSPWRSTGITRNMLERARKFAAFRVIIVDGKLYTDLYYQCVQSRAMFTVWGLLLLLERFPGMVPDVEFMFNCMDRPHFFKQDFKNRNPPPLFAYCGTQSTFDIPFPDWSYWGWAEVNIGPWSEESGSIFRGSESTRWINREPRAYWKGNPHVGASVRTELLACNSSDSHDFGADIYIQNWLAEAQEGYKNSKLSSQCGHRYKLYAEGYAWSVSFKYIMACGSTLLLINPKYHDFFMRGLVPREHYWPIDRHNMCPSIEHAVEWGNTHNKLAEKIGRRGQEFLRNDLSMDHVYDYMLHLLVEYSRLQRFTPTVPEGAQRVCRESILCIAEPLHRKFLERSVGDIQKASPCRLPPADASFIVEFNRRSSENLRAVEKMEIAYSNTALKQNKPTRKFSKKLTSKRKRTC